MTPNWIAAAVLAWLALIAWLWWTYHAKPAVYGPDWARKVQEYWTRRGRFCHVCHGPGHDVHHRRGAGHHWPVGHEPLRVLLGVCTTCHMERIHRLDHWLDRKLGFNRAIVLRFSTWAVKLAWLPVRIVRRPYRS